MSEDSSTTPQIQEVQVHRRPQKVNDTNLNLEPGGIKGSCLRCLPKDFKQVLDGLQRLVCLALASWALLHTSTPNNLVYFIIILAAGHVDPRGAKDILVRALRGIISEK